MRLRPSLRLERWDARRVPLLTGWSGAIAALERQTEVVDSPLGHAETLGDLPRRIAQAGLGQQGLQARDDVRVGDFGVGGPWWGNEDDDFAPHRGLLRPGGKLGGVAAPHLLVQLGEFARH